MVKLAKIKIQGLAEDHDLEIKKAAGPDGQGKLPKSFFESYSAMANTNGGVILLGIEENPPEIFSVIEIQNLEKLKNELWDGLNNNQRISINLLNNNDVQIVPFEGKSILKVHVPRASRTQRPVYLGNNPLTGTYRRNFRGDYRCDERTVRRMLAEQIEETRDAILLNRFGMEDIETDSLRSYRNEFKATRQDHPWLGRDDQDFLHDIGGWTKNRETGKEGLTLAGLLMFGKLRSILDILPNYVVDYQERPEPKTEFRWIDRITTDGTWSGNVYDFYRRVILKLFNELKVPFRLEGTQRIDETPVHEAIREALINTLIHADYSGRVSILIVKRPDMFGFRNPGLMRLSLADALRGGISDCRNRNLQKMFQLIGKGEQAGSGIPRIYDGWMKQHWRAPELWEQDEPEQTLLAMRMVHLLPDETIHELDERFGEKFRKLPELQRLALATVAIEGKLTHTRLKSITSAHPHDLTKTLTSLVKKDFLESSGVSRGTVYYFPGERPEEKDQMSFMDFWSVPSIGKGDLFAGSVQTKQDSKHFNTNSVHLSKSSVQMKHLEKMGQKIKDTKKATKNKVIAAIVQLCDTQYLTSRQLADFLGRSSEYLRIHYLNKMVKNGDLRLRYPDKPNHPEQAYKTKDKAKN